VKAPTRAVLTPPKAAPARAEKSRKKSLPGLIVTEIAFLPRSKSFNFMVAVTIYSDFGAPKIKSLTVSIVSPPICHEVIRLDAMIFIF